MSSTADWDAETYDRLAAPQEEWARSVLERLPLAGDEIVLDAGCGSGRVTKLLLERLPNGRVIGVDGSPSMVAKAKESLTDHGDRITVFESDLLDLTPELLSDEADTYSVDAIFSNATFHWIGDHALLFSQLRALLRPGGRLVAQCGGGDNVTEWVDAVVLASESEPFAEHIGGFFPWHFYFPPETEQRLEAAGFEEVRSWLEEKPTKPEDARGFVGVSGLASLHERLPEELREPFTEAVLEELPEPVELRFVRLNIEGRARGAA